MVKLMDRLRVSSGGRIDGTVHYSGEVAAAYDEYKAVKDGIIDMGLTGSYQWAGAIGPQLANLFGGSGFPAGPSPIQNIAWFEYGDGQKLANEYVGDWGVVVGFIGSTGELFAHSNVRMEKIGDFEGVKFRTAGVWGDILTTYYGATVTSLPGGEVYQAAERGVIDAFEYSSAATNWPMGFHEITEYLHVPGIHSPGGGGFFIVNHDAWDALPDDLKLLVEDACTVSDYDAYQTFVYEDALAMQEYRDYGTEIVVVSDEFQRDITAKSKEYHAKFYNENPDFKKVWDNLENFISVYQQQQVVVPSYSVFE
jgi:TRAP-type mannitol/chloroaromatic compound transport system substrate-binding protein